MPERQTCSAPGLEAPDKIRGSLESNPLQVRGGQARLVARVTHDDQLAADVADALVARRAGGVAPPLQHVARYEDGAGHHTVALALKL
jgi:hypothetical protein